MITSLTFLVFGLGMFLLGVIAAPLVIFMRARKDDAWDESNMMNIYRLVAHIGTHPSDFGKVKYENGKNPFWYISKDEITEVVNARP